MILLSGPVRWAGVATAIGFIGCELLYRPLTGPNPLHCANNPGICSAAQVCDPQRGVCIDVPDGMGSSVDMPMLPDLGDPVSRPTATVVNPGTIINGYTLLAADAKAGDTTVRVASTTALGVMPGDLLMLIQMQGATYDTSDGATYGTVTSLNGAGSYEIVSVQGVDPIRNVLALNYCAGLQNAYSVAGRTQVVRVPQYRTLDVAQGASIVALPWSDTTGGGVIAAYVQQTATLLGDIDASGAGFRGGPVDNLAQTPSTIVTTFRSADAADGAQKGEGIGGSQADYDAISGRYGRGAPANGGGGGNSHNGGGGGGGGANQPGGDTWTGQGVMNAGGGLWVAAWMLDPAYQSNGNALTRSSGGGRGGYSASGAANDPRSVGPGQVVWGLNSRAVVGGLGGHPLDTSATGRLFLGGGGGAGNGNNGAAGAGGRGGGVVFLVAGAVAGSGQILANGSPGGDTKAGTPGNDGAGGGGGGGTVIVLAGRTLSGALHRAANGGNGGNQQVSVPNEAEGPGGGGGGGLVGSFAGALGAVATSTGGGSAGKTSASVMSNFQVNGATSGASPFPMGVGYGYAAGPMMPICNPSDLQVTAVSTANGQVTVTIRNIGPLPAQAVSVSDTSFSAMEAATWSCSATGGAVCPSATGSDSIATITDLPISGALQYVVSLSRLPGYTGPLLYGISASLPPGFRDPDQTNNAANVTIP